MKIVGAHSIKSLIYRNNNGTVIAMPYMISTTAITIITTP